MKKINIKTAVSVAAAVVVIICLLLVALSRGRGDELPALLGGERAREPFCALILGRDRTSGLADVIMLAYLDREAGRAAVLQIPRDTYAEYTEGSYKKLNGAPSVIGEEGLCELLSRTFGIQIDGYVSADLDALAFAVDKVGGVELYLDEPLDYEDPEQELYIHLAAGEQTLSGEQAEMLVRFRSGYIRGDLDRLDMQKRFMAAFFEKLRDSINITNAYSFLCELLPATDTDLPPTRLLQVGLDALELESADISFFTLPGGDVRAEQSGASYYCLSAEDTRLLLCEHFGKSDGLIDEEHIFLNERYKAFRDIYSK